MRDERLELSEQLVVFLTAERREFSGLFVFQK